ncbi:FadR/GntR family transcriptional regulator [Sphingobacterium paludis]|uniref:DNA-binding FadR family transcriptional regulator n=1 Tax=Sphingobacterium paludis TaxID=1476465 RepID=A0A4R7CX27_9SPHI|nr:FadR/GntR family transcriptional regulator [Sphingobacterium paludis]TDS10238.1 DNA-binding FadR family transcriptional regulator [Sphingobacterium paludis]
MIKRTSLAEEVSERIKAKIKTGEYGLGSRLPTEPALMQVFGVGRSSVREAIRMLANLGYLDVQQGVGTFVAGSDGNEALGEVFEKAPLADLLEVRQLLEIRIAEKAAENRSTKDLGRMAAALKKRKIEADAGALETCIEADIAFHQAIADACGNPILMELYGTSSKHVAIAFKQIYANTTVFVSTQVSHERLFLAIEQRDAAQARSLLNEIIESV